MRISKIFEALERFPFEFCLFLKCHQRFPKKRCLRALTASSLAGAMAAEGPTAPAFYKLEGWVVKKAADDTLQEKPEAVVHYVYNIAMPTTLGRGSGDAADTAANKLCL